MESSTIHATIIHQNVAGQKHREAIIIKNHFFVVFELNNETTI